MRKLIASLFLSLAAIGFIVVNGCSKEQKVPTYSYGGPGSAYTATLSDDGTFTITHAPSVGATVTMTITGTYSRLASGFVKLTVTGSTGSGAPASGSTALGLEVPGFALLLKPAGNESEVIPMVVAGQCPTADMTLNWMVTDKDDATSAASTSADYLGVFQYTASTNSATLPNKYALQAFTSLGSGTVGTLSTCSNGILNFTGGAMWLTSQGGALVHATGSGPTNDQVIVAMPSSTISSTTGFAGSYAGLVFDKTATDGSGNRIFPVSVSMTSPSASTMTGTGTKMTDVEANTLSTDSATLTISSIDSPQNGFMKGTISIGGSTGTMGCMAKANVVDSNKNMMFCIAQSPQNNTKMFNILLISK